MKILIVHPRMNIMGGGERVAIHSIKEALREGHEVYLATEQFGVQAFEDFFGVEGVLKDVRMLMYPPFRPIMRRAVLYQRTIYSQEQLRRILHKNPKFDMVFNTGEVGNQPATRSPSAEYCYFPEHFSHIRTGGSSGPWQLYYEPARIFYRSRVARITRLLAVSDFTRTFVKKLWGRESTTLYPPCPIEPYVELHPPKEDTVVTIGRIAPEKRMELFLNIALRLPKVKFVIIGSIVPDKKSYYEHLKARAPENVSMIISPLRKVKNVLASAKVYVHCAENEHFGIAIVEAMAAGCVPAVHNSGGPTEIVSDDVGYKWDSIDQAVVQVSRIIGDDELRMRLSNASIIRARRFRPERFESGIREVFRSLSGGT